MTPKKARKKAGRVKRIMDWTEGDRLLKEGASPKAVAKLMKCATCTAYARRRAVAPELYAKLHSPKRRYITTDRQYFPYSERLTAWFKVLHEHGYGHMTFDEFRAWFKTGDGQALLQRINDALAFDRAHEQKEIDYHHGNSRAQRMPAHA